MNDKPAYLLPPDLTVKKHAERHWQIGPYVVKLGSDHEDSELSAWKHGFRLLHEGRHEWATTFRMAPYHWRVDGHHVVLPNWVMENGKVKKGDDGQPLAAPDTEEAARAVLAEAQAPADDA